MNALPSIRLRFTLLFVLGLATLKLLIHSPVPFADSREWRQPYRPARIAQRKLLAGRFLLASDGTARSLAGTCVRLRSLATDGQATTVAEATVATDVHEALDVELHLAAQVTLDLEFLLDHAAEAGDLGFGEVLDPGVRADFSLGEDRLRARESDAVNVRQSVLDTLVARKINSGYTCHLST